MKVHRLVYAYVVLISGILSHPPDGNEKKNNARVKNDSHLHEKYAIIQVQPICGLITCISCRLCTYNKLVHKLIWL